MIKWFPPLTFLFLTNAIGAIIYHWRYKILPGVNFVNHLDGLGSAIASYATAMMALVFALIVILTSLDNDNIRRFKALGYLEASIIFYLFCFLQLGITLAFSLLCLSNIKIYFIASLTITFAIITLFQIILIVFQIVLLSIRK
ncbi:TPA: hypothetical protein M2P66_000070 [Klebsiella quasipneumoniae]|jgi:hypothetical protein|uniref:hypothetical protein n=1 Tax=Enterobacterales TaxID=91347 RepID=UPI0013EEF870|nr:hypothetical protein G3M83_12190 [Rouxiella badensis]HDK6220001.1 hypothetical protein [Klebsiella quasipneumoniae]